MDSTDTRGLGGSARLAEAAARGTVAVASASIPMDRHDDRDAGGARWSMWTWVMIQ
jgi:hypothetical protein